MGAGSPRLEYDYIVVGSGAGGGTVAARLAEAGMDVILLEAGSDPDDSGLSNPAHYDVPAFHAFASEDPAIAWNFRVHDFAGDGQRCQRECGASGVLYPRASTLGGCTAHNAMILLYPHDTDWNHIAALTGDASWSATEMRRYFQHLEDCRYRPFWRFLSQISGGRFNPTGHGWSGWLATDLAAPLAASRDHSLMRVIKATIEADLAGGGAGADVLQRAAVRLERWARFLIGESDPNDRRLQGRLDEGLCEIPLTTFGGRRRGARERVHWARRHGLEVEFDALATRVVLDAENRAIGVDYLKGRSLYRASARSESGSGSPRSVHARCEVVLAGGAFNTPQLLMLSGIGPAEQLSALGIKPMIPLEGVGRNLQDRYEVGLVHKALRPWASMKEACFAVDDPLYREWLRGRGMYTSNGAAVGFAFRSRPTEPDPDLFAMALLTRFAGYFSGYSEDIRNSRDDLTFALLKAHTKNRAGTVTLSSPDPRDPPRIDFRYFEEGSDGAGEDLAAVVAGVRRLRNMTARLEVKGLIGPEQVPGPEASTDEALQEFVRQHAWGHHASGTCAIAPRRVGGVLDSKFRVHGTAGLRVVDASVFPRIPGFFVACAVYVAAEKAAEMILDDAKGRREFASGRNGSHHNPS